MSTTYEEENFIAKLQVHALNKHLRQDQCSILLESSSSDNSHISSDQYSVHQ